MNARTISRTPQAGMTMLVVLVLLSVMLLGGLALARVSAVGTLVAGNVAFKERAVQVSEVGVNRAFQAIQPPFNEDADSGTWYFAVARATDAQGVPVGIDLEQGTSVDVGPYNVRYVVERMCTVAAVTDPLRECLVREASPPAGFRDLGDNARPIDLPSVRQFRITARVTGPKGTRTVVQSMVARRL